MFQRILSFFFMNIQACSFFSLMKKFFIQTFIVRRHKHVSEPSYEGIRREERVKKGFFIITLQPWILFPTFFTYLFTKLKHIKDFDENEWKELLARKSEWEISYVFQKKKKVSNILLKEKQILILKAGCCMGMFLQVHGWFYYFDDLTFGEIIFWRVS